MYKFNYFTPSSFIYYINIVLILNSCSNLSNNNQATVLKNNQEVYRFKFNIESPCKKIKLSKKLNEISGLSYYMENKLLCLEDEHSDIYTIDYNTNETECIYNSSKKGDFEGIEYANNTIYILKSNGEIISLNNFKSQDVKIESAKTGLSSKNDTEGLTIDYTGKKLLIACKESPNLKKSDFKHYRSKTIYSFDINNKELNEEPEFIIDLDEIEKLTGIKKVKPSGIALHPIEKNYYIVSSVGKLIIVLNQEGKIIYIKKMPSKIFEQPEGICFNSDGTILFISNEGKKSAGNVLMFNILK